MFGCRTGSLSYCELFSMENNGNFLSVRRDEVCGLIVMDIDLSNKDKSFKKEFAGRKYLKVFPEEMEKFNEAVA